MYTKTLFVALFVIIAATGTLMTAISYANPARATALGCIDTDEKDTRSCPNPSEIRSNRECDTKATAGRACGALPPPTPR